MTHFNTALIALCLLFAGGAVHAQMSEAQRRSEELNSMHCGRITSGNAEYMQCMENWGPDAHPDKAERQARIERARALDQKARDNCANKARTSVEPKLRDACKSMGLLK